MKKTIPVLIIKCILVFIPLWMFFFLAKMMPLYYLNPDTLGAYWNNVFTYTKQSEDYDVVILGDSMAAQSFMPELLSDSTVNLSLAGSTPVEGYYTLENYLKHNDVPTDVFCCYMDYHLEDTEFTWDVSNIVRKFSLGQSYEIYKAMKMSGVDEIGAVTKDEYWNDVLQYTFYLPSKYSVSVVNTFTENRYEANQKLFNQITYRAGRYCTMTNDIFGTDGYYYTDFEVSPFKDYYYQKIVQLCAENNIKLHIVKLPLSGYNAFSDEYIDKVNAYYDNLLGDNENMEFDWFSEPYYYEWYWDYYHMNQHGSKAFSLTLKNTFPDLFGDYSASPRQMLAINDDINIENIPAEVFKWIDQKDYTVLLYDNLQTDDDFSGVYVAYFQYNNQYLQSAGVDNLYYVSGNGDTIDNLQIVSNGSDISVTVDGNDTTDIDIASEGVTMVVIDNSNHVIVRNVVAEFDLNSVNFMNWE